MVVHTSTSTVTTSSVDGQLPENLPDEIRQQIASALGQAQGERSSHSGAATLSRSPSAPRRRVALPLIVAALALAALVAGMAVMMFAGT
jgi:hypothetical protein